MPLTIRANGTGASNLISASWFNDFANLFTGQMKDQPITFRPNTTLQAIAAPPGAPTLALSSGSALGVGVYQYGVTLVSADGGETLLGTTATITTTSGNQSVSLTAIPTDSNNAATKRRLYRTKVGGSTFYLLTTINDNTTTSYTDSTADASLPTTTSPAYPTFGGSLVVKDASGTTKLTIASDGSILFGGKLGYLSAGDTIDTTSASDTYVKARGGAINFQPTNGTTNLSVDSTGLVTVKDSTATTRARIQSNGSVYLETGKISSDGLGNLSLTSILPNVGTTINGTTAGSATLFQFMTGTVKAFVVYFNNYRNGSATEQTISLPTPFTVGATFLVSASKGVRPYLSGTALSSKVNVVTTISNGTTAGGVATGNATQGYSYGDFQTAFDAVGLGTSETGNTTGFAWFFGS